MKFLKNDRMLWDDLAQGYSDNLIRNSQQRNWYDSHLIPTVVECVSHKKRVLDFGCGDGYLANLLSSKGHVVTGIDVSEKMINIGKRRYPTLDLRSGDITKTSVGFQTYDAIVANMVLHDIDALEKVVDTLVTVLQSKGRFIFSIPHPCFYTESGRAYFDGKTPSLEISKYKTPGKFFKFEYLNTQGVRHYHRPLGYYFKLCFDRAFVLTDLREIFDADVHPEIPFALVLVFDHRRA